MVREERLTIISSYPLADSIHSHRDSAVSSYTTQLVTSFKTISPQLQITILADKLNTPKYTRDGITIKRIWQRDTLLTYLRLFFAILRDTKTKTLLIQYEWSLFGNTKKMLAVFPLFLLCLAVLGKKIYLVSHGVLLDETVLAELFHIKNNQKKHVMAFFLHCFYFIMLLCTKKVIVHETYLKQLFDEAFPPFMTRNKLSIIPHGVAIQTPPLSYSSARDHLGVGKKTFVIMCFGFLNWYKGSDWIISAMKTYFDNFSDTNVVLYVVGGETKRGKTDPSYISFLQAILTTVASAEGHIIYTGFVPENLIATYYQAADLLLFPYRTMLSSSGALSLAFSYNKPFLLSEPLNPYTTAPDFENALETAGIQPKDIIFPLTNEALYQRISILSIEKESLEKLSMVSKILSLSRSWDNAAKQYLQELDLTS